ncbi:MAG: hypothetical protein M1831_004567 [Alyxoria varia]|nr:MAG: hypothetical protein M1831_004567 [Alyxoria varia]
MAPFVSSAGSHDSGRRQRSRSTLRTLDTPNIHLADQREQSLASESALHEQKQRALHHIRPVNEKPLPNVPTAPSTTRKTKLIFSRWGWELLSCLGAVIAILAIYGLLLKYNDKTVPDWPNVITINSLVSIFSTLLKALMLVSIVECLSQLKWLWFESPRSLKDVDTFDQASRGPLGSSKLIFKLQARQLAALGAYITILAIGIDPFAQQAIQYYNCFQIDTERNASVPVSRYRHSGNSQFDGRIMGALWDGLLNPSGNNTAIQPHCPTGFCDFEAKYSSLGFCSGCINSIYRIRSTVNVTHEGVDEDDREFYGQIWMNHGTEGGTLYSQPNLHVRKNMALRVSSFADGAYYQPLEKGPFRPKSSPYNKPDFLINGTGAPLLYVSTIGPTYDKQCTSDWIDDPKAKKSTDCIVPRMLTSETKRNAREPTGIYVTNYPNQERTYRSFHTGDGTYGFPPMIDWPNVTSSTCYLSYCAKTYSATMRNGTFQEKLIGEQDVLNLASKDRKRVYFVSRPCVTDNQTYQLSDILDVEAAKKSGALVNSVQDIDGQIHDGTSGNYTQLREDLPAGSRNRSLLDACTFSMSWQEYTGLRETFPNYLNGKGNFSEDATQPKPWLDPWQNATWVEWDASLHLSAFFNDGSPSVRHSERTMNHLSEAMTNHLRKTDARGSVVNGEMRTSETCVRAAWPWLTLPLVLVIGTCIFQIATMIKATRHSKMVGDKDNVWKSSQLALLYHGLDEEPAGPVYSLNDMDREAKNTNVQLSAKDDGWKLLRPRTVYRAT